MKSKNKKKCYFVNVLTILFISVIGLYSGIPIVISDQTFKSLNHLIIIKILNS